jgi:hypothetical protein
VQIHAEHPELAVFQGFRGSKSGQNGSKMGSKWLKLAYFGVPKGVQMGSYELHLTKLETKKAKNGPKTPPKRAVGDTFDAGFNSTPTPDPPPVKTTFNGTPDLMLVLGCPR